MSKMPGGYSRPLSPGNSISRLAFCGQRIRKEPLALPIIRCPPTSTGRPFFNSRRRDYASAIFPKNPHYFLRIFRTPLRPSKNALPVTFFCEQAGITLQRDSELFISIYNSLSIRLICVVADVVFLPKLLHYCS